MKAVLGNRFSLAQIIVFSATSLLLLWVIQLTTASTVDDLREQQMHTAFRTGDRGIDAELDEIQANIEYLRRDVLNLKGRGLPALNDLRAVAQRFGQKIVRVEHSPMSNKKTSFGELYLVVVRGPTVSCVQFLNQLESQFLVHADRVLLQAVDDRGQTVDLGLTLYLGEK